MLRILGICGSALPLFRKSLAFVPSAINTSAPAGMRMFVMTRVPLELTGREYS
jgi:hypothetical protein